MSEPIVKDQPPTPEDDRPQTAAKVRALVVIGVCTVLALVWPHVFFPLAIVLGVFLLIVFGLVRFIQASMKRD